MARTKPAAEIGMKKSEESTPLDEILEESAEKPSVPNVRLQSVQLLYPTEILNRGSLAQVSDGQVNLQWFKAGVLCTSKDERYNGITFIPMSAIKALKFMDAFPGELLIN